jgi:hypothetical protein
LTSAEERAWHPVRQAAPQPVEQAVEPTVVLVAAASVVEDWAGVRVTSREEPRVAHSALPAVG